MTTYFRLTLALLLTSLSLSLAPSLSAAEKITRGPYLQMPTTNSMVIRWRTEKERKSYVRYGLTPVTATNLVRSPGVFTEHVVQLTKLKPDTRYYYSVGYDTNKWITEVGPDFSFLTPPMPGPARPTRIWALGDPGTANTNQMAVRDAFYKWSGRNPDLWLMLGDNAYSDGTDAQYGKAVFDMYGALHRQVALWPTLGNHDALSASSPTQSGVYYDVFTLPTLGQSGGLPSGTEAYYSFDYANIHFICLDSQDTDRSPRGTMATWLQADLDSTAREWIICFFHHPPYSKGGHDSDKKSDSGSRLWEMRENILPILEAGGVDFVLCGHSHDYERTFLLNGHYGTSTNLTSAMILNHGDGRADGNGAYAKPAILTPNKGAVYVVSGSAGQTEAGRLNHPAMYLSLKKLGSLVIDIDGLTAEVKFIGDRGQVRDYFTLRKK